MYPYFVQRHLMIAQRSVRTGIGTTHINLLQAVHDSRVRGDDDQLSFGVASSQAVFTVLPLRVLGAAKTTGHWLSGGTSRRRNVLAVRRALGSLACCLINGVPYLPLYAYFTCLPARVFCRNFAPTWQSLLLVKPEFLLK